MITSVVTSDDPAGKPPSKRGRQPSTTCALRSSGKTVLVRVASRIFTTPISGEDVTKGRARLFGKVDTSLAGDQNTMVTCR